MIPAGPYYAVACSIGTCAVPIVLAKAAVALTVCDPLGPEAFAFGVLFTTALVFNSAWQRMIDLLPDA